MAITLAALNGLVTHSGERNGALGLAKRGRWHVASEKVQVLWLEKLPRELRARRVILVLLAALG